MFANFDLQLRPPRHGHLGACIATTRPRRSASSPRNVASRAIQVAPNPGYARPPTTQTLFFGERGPGEFEAAHLFDLALNYEVPIVKTARRG